MIKKLKSLQNYLKENIYQRYLLYFILGFVIFFGAVILWKYFNFKYDELDLAIFNQTFFNSVHGRFLENSIQGQSYFGDHFAPLMFLLAPIYFIFQSPLTLLILQLSAIAGATWLLFLITEKKLENKKIALLISILFLLNFSIQQIVLFGFHLLPFFFCLFFWVYYAYLQNNYRWYVIGIIACLLLREDLALVLIPFSLIPFLEKRTIKWWIMPLVSGVVYFPIALYIISFFNLDGSYKFIQMYGWLGQSWGEIITTITTQPFYVLKNLQWGSIFELLLGFLLPFFFVPILGWRWLLIPSIVLAVHILPASGVEQIILQTHYSSLIWPFVFLAVIESFTNKFIQKNYILISIIILISTIYTMVLLGPVHHFSTINREDVQQETDAAYELMKQIPDDAGVVVSSELLPTFSNRESVYSLHYLFWGTRQFSEESYEIDHSVEYLLFNVQEFRFLMSQVSDNQALYYSGQQKIEVFMKQRGFMYQDSLGDYLLFSKDKKQDYINATQVINKKKLNFNEFTYYSIKSCDVNFESERNGFIPFRVEYQKTNIKPEESKLYYLGLKENNEDFLFGPNTYIQITGGDEFMINHGYHAFFDNDMINNSYQEFTYWVPKNSLSKDTEFIIMQKQEASYFNYLGFIDFIELRNVELESFRFDDWCTIN